MPWIWISLSVLLTAGLGIGYPVLLPWMAMAALLSGILLLWQEKKRGSAPRDRQHKQLKRIEKKRHKEEQSRHLHIHDQIRYISQKWGYTQEQSRVIERFIEQRAYSDSYNRLTASLLPQLITLIDQCNAKGQKGCKREVGRRIRELTELMKAELKRQSSRRQESFEVALEVYDRLLSEQR